MNAELQRELTQLRTTVDTLGDKVDENNQLLRKLYCSSGFSMAVPSHETAYSVLRNLDGRIAAGNDLSTLP